MASGYASVRKKFVAQIHFLPAFALTLFLLGSSVRADSAAFDLTGPHLQLTVTRAGKTLPVSDVANLQAGDRIWIHPQFPEDQSAHYLVIVAFLRGTTNPPPENWLFREEGWAKKVRDEGFVVTVPQGAQQCLLFLAPETGGDFSTLRSAVSARPGIFVRASQDLNLASLDRLRLDKYLAEIKQTPDYDPKALKERSQQLAKTLDIKVNQDCFDKPAEEQATCLTQREDQLVLDDGHTQSMVAALTSGPSADLAAAVSATPLAGAGTFSPYVGAIVDLGRLLGNLHTAEYQYIPALAISQKDELNLRLNSPPSFKNPKSVLVVGLPAVEAAQFPPLRAAEADHVYCLQKSPLVLPANGAPLVFSTSLAHDFVLRVPQTSGKDVDLPATPDPAQGGFVIDAHSLPAGSIVSQVKGTLHGRWGFEEFDGPSFNLRGAHAAKWTVPAADQSALVVGREDTLHLDSECAVCADAITALDTQGHELKTTWKLLKPDEVEIHIPLSAEQGGLLTLRVKQLGIAQPDEFSFPAYAEAAHLDRFMLNAGDSKALLVGTRLDEVKGLEVSGVRFVPGKLTRNGQNDNLPLLASTTLIAGALKPDESVIAHVVLKDGRVLNLQTEVAPPRLR
jgi:hypothetical protein